MKVVEEFDTIQGEGKYLGVPSYFIRTVGCNLRCLDENTEILLTDFSTKKIKNIKVGDELWGVELYKPGNSTRSIYKLKPQRVLKKWLSESLKKQVEVIYNDKKIICSEDHKFLCVQKKSPKKIKWKQIKNYNEKKEYLFHVPHFNLQKDTLDYKKGYTVGITMGDGSINGNQISFGFANEALAKYVHSLFTEIWKNENKIYTYRKSTTGNQIYDLRYGNKKFVNFYNEINPLEQTNEFIRGFCAGVFDAEGTHSVNGNCYISSTNKKESKIIHKCFEKININSSITSWKSEAVKSKIVYAVNINGSVLQRNKVLAELNIKCKYKILWNLMTPEKIIVKVQKINKQHKLYDIETELHNFIANGIVVHNCAWKDKTGVTICDTPYTSWNPEKAYDLDVEGLIKKLNKLGRKHVVITGGEPLLQPDIDEVVNSLLYNENVVTVETNGTIYNPNMKGAFMSISPKLKSSYAQEEGTFEYDIHRKNNDFTSTLKEWIKTNDYQVKFVINDESDLDEMVGVQVATRFRGDKTYLMPQGITKEQLTEKSQWLFQKCLDYNVNFSPRMHIDVFGNKRGI